MSYTYPMYVCDRCGFSHYHPISYCAKCPGRMERRNVIHPDGGRFESDAHMQKHLRGQGLTYLGEYPAIPTEEVKAVKRERYRESLTEAMALEAYGKGAAEKKKGKILRDYWQREIDRLDNS